MYGTWIGFGNMGMHQSIITRINCMRDDCGNHIDGQKRKKEDVAFCTVSFGRIHVKASASFTVEAALIVPIILLVITSFLYLFMYCHDKAVLTYAAERACLMASYEKDFETMERIANDTVFEEIQTKVLINREVETETTLTDEELIVFVKSTSDLFVIETKAKAMVSGELSPAMMKSLQTAVRNRNRANQIKK